MQVLKQNKKAVLLIILLVAVLIISLFVTLRVYIPATKPSPSPASPTPSPVPTKSSPSSTSTTSSPTVQPSVTPFQIPLPTNGVPEPTPSGGLYPGEVTEYQNQSLTPISDFVNEFLQTTIMGAQNTNVTAYRLTVGGLVNQTMQYTYDQVLNDFQSHEKVVPILCVEGWSATILWQGVYISDLLQQAGVSPQANTLIFNGSDGYTSALPLSYVLQNNLILAYKMNNVTLTPDTGFPFILVAQNQYGYKWVKYVTEIDVSNDSSYLGYWESRGYPNDATINGTAVPSSYLTTVEILGASAVVIVMIIAVYLILVKTKKRYAESPPRKRQAPSSISTKILQT